MYSWEEKRNEQIKNRKLYYISSDPTGIEQVNEHLTYEDLYKLYSGKYRDDLSENQRNRLLKDESLLKKIRHVEICPQCMSMCANGYHLWWDLTGGAIALPVGKFFESFNEFWIKSKTQQLECSVKGHNFNPWSFYTYRTMTDSEFDIFPVKEGEYLHEVWKRKCSCCGFEEKTLENPEQERKL